VSQQSAGASPGTGRLFRSLRASGNVAESAIPALSIDQAVGLRSMTLGVDAPMTSNPAPTAPPPRGAAVGVGAVVSSSPISSGAISSGAISKSPPANGRISHGIASDNNMDDLEYAEVAPRLNAPVGAGERDVSRRARHATPGLPASGVWLVVIGVTVVMGFADALVTGRTGIGWLTGIALLAVSVYGAIVVRPDDIIIAVIAPPLAFFLATITAGQLTLTPSGDLFVREAFMIITTLGNNALWIFGATIAALVIVVVRRRRRAIADQVGHSV
jgi:hypothetical protein